MINAINTVMAYAVMLPTNAHQGHEHGEGESVWQEAFELITDPAHAITEMFYNVVFELILIAISFFLYNKFQVPRIRKKIHKEIDTAHGINHDNVHTNNGHTCYCNEMNKNRVDANES